MSRKYQKISLSSLPDFLDILQTTLFDTFFEDFQLEDLPQEKVSKNSDIDEMLEELDSIKRVAEEREEKERIRKEKLKKEEENRRLEEEKKEHIEKVTSMDLPLDWENAFSNDIRTQGVHIESVPDALIMSLSELARVDIEYIASVTDKDYKTVISELKGSIYQNPETWDECFYKGWESADEYLSGNIMKKLQAARKASDEYNGYFDDNIHALEKLLPDTVSSSEIYITLGSPWVPVDIIDDFITHIMGIRGNRFSGTKHDEITGTWEIPHKGSYSLKYYVASSHTYGTSRMGALYILEKTLNMKTIAVVDTFHSYLKKTGKRVVNRSETILAIEKQNKLVQEFQKWVRKDSDRKKRLERIFEEKFGSIRKRNFDGSFLRFPTMSSQVELYPYQKDAVARILFSPNTLLAHEVGSGKTYVMIAAGMELKRTGLSSKNLYVVPNNLIGQWQGIFKSLYPDAKLLCVEPKSFTPDKRKKVLEKIKDEDFDGIIMAYSCFDMIPISVKFYMNELRETERKLDEIAKNPQKATSKVFSKNARIHNTLNELKKTIGDPNNSVFFDELGVTRLFVDEAHNYKNIPIETKIDRVLGIRSSGSKKCREMLDKVHIVQNQNNGSGVVMATGTPITNSVTDVFVVQKYLQGGELAMLDLQNFDSWVGMFAERMTEFEIDVDTDSYRMATRFARFHNLPELTSLLSSVADFHKVDKLSEIPDFSGYSDVLIPKTEEFSDYLKEISNRADDVRSGLVRRTEDNMLKITTDGRKAALDLRLVEPKSSFTHTSKVAHCAENVFEVYRKTQANRSTQLIFCDVSTPKAGFNIYSEMKRLLTGMGVPGEEIAFIHDAETEKQRKKLFADFRAGDIRILIGSTFKLGTGVNVQDKLIALHHLDVPWRPADMTQREGRILRQGNENDQVEIYRYITQGSFDAYSWQLLETKQRFISALLSGSMNCRSSSDIEDTVLNYAEVKALAVGNSLVKKRVETANELERYQELQRKAVEEHIRIEKELLSLPGKIENQKKLIKNCESDIAFYQENRKELTTDERRDLRKILFESLKENVLQQKETVGITYQGFSVIFPANMSEKQPYILLQRDGRYFVELGNSERGILMRIDNFLENMQTHLEKLKDIYRDYCNRQVSLQQEITLKQDYTEKIQDAQKRLEKLDKKLGVNKK